jgi:deoxyadenosine/deoxycytidine kinase
MFVGVSGLIGVGKSTLTTQLAEHYGGTWKAY